MKRLSSLVYIKFILGLRYADQVSVDDEVLANNKIELTPIKVISILDLTMQGIIYCNLF